MSAAHSAHLAGIDVNLLVHLDALVGELSVTRAARRVGLSQSAMSRSLAKLRVLLADPLLVRGAGGLGATPRARALTAPLADALRTLDQVVHAAPAFDPRTAARTFTLASSDYADALLVPPLLERLGADAPGVDVAVVPSGREAVARVEGEEADLAVGPRRGGGAGIVWKRLYRETFASIVRVGHPAARRKLTIDEFVAIPQVMVAPGGRPGSLLDDALARIGRRRRVAVRVTSFLVAPLIVATSDLIATLPRRLAERAARLVPLRVLVPPVPLEPFDMLMAWHERNRHDPGHAWFRRVVSEVASAAIPRA
jgi:DNA-binding transcriptional LysR family regulator